MSLMEPISLTLGQKFELEKRSRDINAITDVQQLQTLTKDLLLAWQQEIARSRAAVADVLRWPAEVEINDAGWSSNDAPERLERLRCLPSSQRNAAASFGWFARISTAIQRLRHPKPAETTTDLAFKGCLENSWYWNQLGALDLDPEVRQFVIAQLLVIIVPVGLMFALWLSLLNKGVQRWVRPSTTATTWFQLGFTILYVRRVAIDLVRAFTKALNSVLKHISLIHSPSESWRSMQYMAGQ
jgi:hypothetical protein